MGGMILEEWRKHALFPVDEGLRRWVTAPAASQAEYLRVLKRAFFPKGHGTDAPTAGRTAAMGTLSETFLRWVRSNQKLNRVLVEPPVPRTTANGDIDLLEIHEDRTGRFFAMAWEAKATDRAAGDPNTVVYSQLDDYPNRLAFEATIISERYHGSNTNLKTFLKNLSAYAYNRGPEVRYGAFCMFNDSVTPRTNFVPHLNVHPVGTHHGAQNVSVSVGVPNFNARRQALWLTMHLQP